MPRYNFLLSLFIPPILIATATFVCGNCHATTTKLDISRPVSIFALINRHDYIFLLLQRKCVHNYIHSPEKLLLALFGKQIRFKSGLVKDSTVKLDCLLTSIY